VVLQLCDPVAHFLRRVSLPPLGEDALLVGARGFQAGPRLDDHLWDPTGVAVGVREVIDGLQRVGQVVLDVAGPARPSSSASERT